jgi:copper chaperone CopZ
MDKRFLLIGLLVMGVIITGCKSEPSGSIALNTDGQEAYQVNLEIDGMYCEACAYGVKAQLEELDGVIQADVNYRTAKGSVLYDASKIDAETIAKASTVYPATVISTESV